LDLFPGDGNGKSRSGLASATSRERKGSGLVTLRSRLRNAIAFGLAVLALAAADVARSPTQAQGRLEASYEATLGGLPLGKGAWLIDVRDDQFSATLNGSTTGLVQVVANGRGRSAVSGTVSAGQPVGAAYASSIISGKKVDEVHMLMNGGTVKEFIAEPPTIPSPNRVPLTEAHRRNVSDPMTAAILRAPSSGNTFSPEVCKRTLSIFDGRMRYDLQLAFKRLETVRSERGYQGTVVVCAVYFSPVAGHIPDRPVIKYLVHQRDAEMWLAPIAGTRLMVPYRLSVPTPLGLAMVQASQFISMPQAASRNGVKSH
jgi:hypothetical protein